MGVNTPKPPKPPKPERRIEQWEDIKLKYQRIKMYC